MITLEIVPWDVHEALTGALDAGEAMETAARDNIEAFIYGGDLVPELRSERDPASDPFSPRLLDGLEAHPEISTPDDFAPYKEPYDEVIR